MHQWPLIKRLELDGCWRFLFLKVCGFVWICLAYLRYSAISVRITMTNDQLLGCFLHNFKTKPHTHMYRVPLYPVFLHPITSYDSDSMIISHFVQSSKPCVCEMVAATILKQREPLEPCWGACTICSAPTVLHHGRGCHLKQSYLDLRPS